MVLPKCGSLSIFERKIAFSTSKCGKTLSSKLFKWNYDSSNLQVQSKLSDILQKWNFFLEWEIIGTFYKFVDVADKFKLLRLVFFNGFLLLKDRIPVY